MDIITIPKILTKKQSLQDIYKKPCLMNKIIKCKIKNKFEQSHVDVELITNYRIYENAKYVLDTNCNLQSFKDFKKSWELYLNIEQDLLYMDVLNTSFSVDIGCGILIPFVDEQMNSLKNIDVHVYNDSFLKMDVY
tara:strand:- start:196 stop:603 length:408 start_codon:yes stop_codon:yes gene_type:complete